MMSKFKLYKAVGWDQASQTYTGKTEPVKWVRIHNLPDLCTSTMLSTSLLQVSNVRLVTDQWKLMKFKNNLLLTMGWCINCHRKQSENGG
jgi:hypothetical protein